LTLRRRARISSSPELSRNSMIQAWVPAGADAFDLLLA
jgi:hypothetical protein